MTHRAVPTVQEAIPRGVASGGACSRLVTVAVAALFAGGCYTYTPLYTAPSAGTRIEIGLNDRGRVALENNVGPEVVTLQGLLRAVTDSQMTLAVYEVTSLYGGTTRWNGERVVIRPEHVRTMRERRYSRPRTIAMLSVLASGTAAFIMTRGLLGGGAEGEGGPSTGGPPPEN
jgi:hypothetical protein